LRLLFARYKFFIFLISDHESTPASMAYRGPVHSVQGAYKTEHVARFPCPTEMFQDDVRREIVQISLDAHNLYSKASLLAESDSARTILLNVAINLRKEEASRWLALLPPDQDGAWKANLAIATYLCQKKDMVAAYDMLQSVYTGAPAESLVCKAATHNLTQMFEQIRSQLPGDCTFSAVPSMQQLACVRAFWVWENSLPE